MNHWFSTRYGYTIKPEWVTLGAGIVYALGTSVKAFTEEGDAMMVMQPADIHQLHIKLEIQNMHLYHQMD